MHADIGDGAEAVAVAIDVNLTAEEGNDAAAAGRHVGDLAQLMLHW